MNPHTPREWGYFIVTLILAIGVTISIVSLTIVEWRSDGHISEAEATLLATVMGAAIGTIATYIGGRNKEEP